MGDYARAEPLYQRSLKIWEKVLGPDHLDTAHSLESLSVLYLLMKDARAEPLYQRVFKIREKVLGPDHPDTVESLKNLDLLYYNMGDLARAKTFVSP
jgi:hypothetical protein